MMMRMNGADGDRMLGAAIGVAALCGLVLLAGMGCHKAEAVNPVNQKRWDDYQKTHAVQYSVLQDAYDRRQKQLADRRAKGIPPKPAPATHIQPPHGPNPGGPGK